MQSWASHSVFYHIYPLGLCGAPKLNDFASAPQPRLAEIHESIPQLRELGVTAGGAHPRASVIDRAS